MKKLKTINLIILNNQKEIQKYILNNEKVIFLFEISEISFETFMEIKRRIDEIIPIALCTDDAYIEIAEEHDIFYLEIKYVSNRFIEYVFNIIFSKKKNDKNYYHDFLNSQELDINCMANASLIEEEKQEAYDIIERFDLDYDTEEQLKA